MKPTRGFTIIEAIAIVIVAVVVAVLTLPLLGRGTPTVPRLRDASQARGIVQSMVIWAGSNKDQYPLPSQLDADGATLGGPAVAKDTTANIYSILICGGFRLDPKYFVSPAEVSNIRADEDYQTSAPQAAVDPARALWDPAFRADFTGRKPGNTSYAHMSPVDAAGQPWKLSFSAERAVLGSRGPQISAAAHAAAGPEFTLADRKSNTLRIHGSPTSWEGNIAYDDNHVDYETSMAPERLLYTVRLSTGSAGPVRARDTLFYDEPDDVISDNNFLTITIPAAGAGGRRAIWD